MIKLGGDTFVEMRLTKLLMKTKQTFLLRTWRLHCVFNNTLEKISMNLVSTGVI